jgi:hypothetical protein
MRSGWHLADCCRDRNQAVVVRRYVEDLAFVIVGNATQPLPYAIGVDDRAPNASSNHRHRAPARRQASDTTRLVPVSNPSGIASATVRQVKMPDVYPTNICFGGRDIEAQAGLGPVHRSELAAAGQCDVGGLHAIAIRSDDRDVPGDQCRDGDIPGGLDGEAVEALKAGQPVDAGILDLPGRDVDNQLA